MLQNITQSIIRSSNIGISEYFTVLKNNMKNNIFFEYYINRITRWNIETLELKYLY